MLSYMDFTFITATSFVGSGSGITGITTAASQILEQFCVPCNGYTVTTAHGTRTVQTVSAVQNLTTTYTDLTGSTITYRPPTGTTTVVYKFQFQHTYHDADQETLPECTDEELWATPTVFKYYKNPSKLDRSTKNFDTLDAANARLASEGSVGIINEVKGQVKACTYCNALNVCNQAKQLIMQGRLLV